MDYGCHTAYIRIMKIAERLLEESQIKSLPINPIVIAKNNDIILIKYSKSRIDKPVFSGFSFVLNDRNIIYYDDKISEKAIRYTIAHEIGHCILGHLIYGKTYYGCSRNVDIDEQEANIFAMSLLMPYKMIKEMKTENEVAGACNVTVKLAKIHLKNLKGVYLSEK